MKFTLSNQLKLTMTIPETVTWKGKSGKIYSYSVYPKSTKFPEDYDRNYIFAKKLPGLWLAVYIGQGDLKTRTQDETHLDCANQKGFTHYHVKVNTSETDRLNEEEDMIKGNPECLYTNGGCNKTSTGQ